MRVGESIHFGLLTVNPVNPHQKKSTLSRVFLKHVKCLI